MPDSPNLCKCGCGQTPNKGREFISGHQQRANAHAQRPKKKRQVSSGFQQIYKSNDAKAAAKRKKGLASGLIKAGEMHGVLNALLEKWQPREQEARRLRSSSGHKDGYAKRQELGIKPFRA